MSAIEKNQKQLYDLSQYGAKMYLTKRNGEVMILIRDISQRNIIDRLKKNLTGYSSEGMVSLVNGTNLAIKMSDYNPGDLLAQLPGAIARDLSDISSLTSSTVDKPAPGDWSLPHSHFGREIYGYFDENLNSDDIESLTNAALKEVSEGLITQLSVLAWVRINEDQGLPDSLMSVVKKHLKELVVYASSPAEKSVFHLPNNDMGDKDLLISISVKGDTYCANASRAVKHVGHDLLDQVDASNKIVVGVNFHTGAYQMVDAKEALTAGAFRLARMISNPSVISEAEKAIRANVYFADVKKRMAVTPKNEKHTLFKEYEASCDRIGFSVLPNILSAQLSGFGKDSATYRTDYYESIDEVLASQFNDIPAQSVLMELKKHLTAEGLSEEIDVSVDTLKGALSGYSSLSGYRSMFSSLISKINLKQKEKDDADAKKALGNLKKGNKKVEVGSDLTGVKHKDTGKIGGARKDDYSRVTYEKALSMTLDEKVKHVKKSKIWPAIKWKDLHKNGLNAGLAITMKYMRDAIDSNVTVPSTSYYGGRFKAKLSTHSEDFNAYTKAVTMVKEFFEAQVELNLDVTDVDFAPLYKKLNSSSGDDGLRYFNHLGSKIRKTLTCYSFEDEESESRAIDMFGSTVVRMTSKVYSAYDFKHREEDMQDWASKYAWRKISSAFRGPSERKQGLKSPFPEHLSSLEISEQPSRVGDIGGQDLKDVFGIRDVEYGEWVSNKERQVILNMSFDSLMDLSDAVGVPAQDIGLGRMAIGFGSRGRGGRARAHYEPLLKVINMTKLKGAGSLAHEWVHALDHLVGDKSGKSAVREPLFTDFADKFITNEILTLSITSPAMYEKRKSDWLKDAEDMKGVCGALVDIIVASKVKEADGDDKKRWALSKLESLKKTLKGWVRHDAYSAAMSMLDPSAESNPAMIDPEDINFDLLDNSITVSKDGVVSFKDSFNDVYHKIIENHIERSGIDCSGRQKEIGEAMNSGTNKMIGQAGRIITDKVSSSNNIKAVMTPFYEEALKMDTSKEYWAKNCELLARSGAAFIADEMIESDRVNDYLVRGSSSDEFASDQYKGNPNPSGETRRKINAAFKGLKSELALYFSDSMELKAARQ